MGWIRSLNLGQEQREKEKGGLHRQRGLPALRGLGHVTQLHRPLKPLWKSCCRTKTTTAHPGTLAPEGHRPYLEHQHGHSQPLLAAPGACCRLCSAGLGALPSGRSQLPANGVSHTSLNTPAPPLPEVPSSPSATGREASHPGMVERLVSSGQRALTGTNLQLPEKG